ncbi:hypothetical protein O3P69_009858 [Scylla paramamosain]|uniref:Uncharacterized protein n=1 Tax=Scylla paramamosain TaxID=85552 RepID=A0AAW0SM70_SCYPA
MLRVMERDMFRRRQIKSNLSDVPLLQCYHTSEKQITNAAFNSRDAVYTSSQTVTIRLMLNALAPNTALPRITGVKTVLYSVAVREDVLRATPGECCESCGSKVLSGGVP